MALLCPVLVTLYVSRPVNENPSSFILLEFSSPAPPQAWKRGSLSIVSWLQLRFFFFKYGIFFALSECSDAKSPWKQLIKMPVTGLIIEFQRQVESSSGCQLRLKGKERQPTRSAGLVAVHHVLALKEVVWLSPQWARDTDLTLIQSPGSFPNQSSTLAPGATNRKA